MTGKFFAACWIAYGAARAGVGAAGAVPRFCTLFDAAGGGASV